MGNNVDIRARALELHQGFVARGAEGVEADILMPAGGLLDLYGEDIRARAYVTQDPMKGEMMLRPDFTLQVTTAHLASGAERRAYVYSGEVFRRQEEDDNRPREVLQVGYERFGDPDPAKADAEVFAAHWEASGGSARAVTGDIGFLSAAVAGLDTPERRKRALMRHLWHPSRFRALLDRFARPAPPPPVFDGAAHRVGLRSDHEIKLRIAALAAEHETTPLSGAERKLVTSLLGVAGKMATASTRLRSIAEGNSGLLEACDRLDARMDALSTLGLDPSRFGFEASFGRSSMEYYDGFVFGIMSPERRDLPALATGGRYDALCAALGGDGVQAVGGVIRPGVCAEAGV